MAPLATVDLLGMFVPIGCYRVERRQTSNEFPRHLEYIPIDDSNIPGDEWNFVADDRICTHYAVMDNNTHPSVDHTKCRSAALSALSQFGKRR